MTLVRFFRADGTLDKQVEAESGNACSTLRGLRASLWRAPARGHGLLDLPRDRRS